MQKQHHGSRSGALERELLAMAERLSDLRSQDNPAAQQLAAELETAMAELKATAEEVNAQQQHLSHLLEQSEQTRATVRRLVAALPTPVLTSDTEGAVVEANDAAARLLGVEVDRLLGQPLPALVAVADRRAVQFMVASAAEGESPEPVTLLLATPGSGGHRVTLVAVPAPGEQAHREIRWLLDPTSPTDGAGRSLALLASFAELLVLPLAEAGTAVVAHHVVDVATRVLPEADEVTLTVGDPRAPDLLISTTDLAQEADAAQLESGEGPCVDAYVTGQLTSSEDLGVDARWPALAKRIRRTPVKATIGVPLDAEGGVLGVLNLYARSGGRMADPNVRARAELFGRAASALLQDNRRILILKREAENLRQALVSRPEIDQAKGILMARFGYSADEAFRHLVEVSQKRNVKLRDVAREVVTAVRRTRPDVGGRG